MPIEPEAPSQGESSDGAVVCSLVAGILAIIAIGLRTGFPDDFAVTALRALGLSWLLIHFPWLVRSVCARLDGNRPRNQRSWWNCESFAMVVTAAGVAKLGWFAGAAGFSLGGAILPIGGILFAAHAAAAVVQRNSSGFRLWRLLALAVVAVFLGVYAAGAVWGSGYQNPLFVERLAAGEGHIDTLFHATLSNMLRTHGVPSTGLDGLPFLHYHFGSHWLIAQICNLLDVAVIDFYNVGYAIVFVPFVIQSVVAFASDLSAGTPHPGGRGLLFWFVLCLGFSGFLPLDAGFATAAARTSIFVSESYAIGVAVSLLAIPIALRYFRIIIEPRAQLTMFDCLAGLLLLPSLVAAVGLSKVSILVVLGVAGFYGLVRKLPDPSCPPMAVYPAILIGVVLAVSFIATFLVSYSSDYSNETGIEPLGFLRGNVETGWWALFWLAYFAWCWVYLAIRCRQAGLRTLGDVGPAMRRRELLDVELLAVVAVAGAIPGLLLTRWSSTHYFSEYQHWLALGLVLSLIPSSRRVQTAAGSNDGFGSLPLSRVASAILALLLSGTMLLNAAALGRQMVAINLASRGYPSGGTGIGLLLAEFRFADACTKLTQQAGDYRTRYAEQFELLEALRGLDRLPLIEKKSALLHIPKDNIRYWRLLKGPYSPQDGPLVAPALSGHAMIDGLYERTPNDRWSGYGYQTYSDPSVGVIKTPPDPETLCIRARQMGYSRILAIEPQPNGTAAVIPSECR